MKIIRSTLALLLTTLLCNSTCVAQPDAWERLRSIEPGKKISVRLASGGTVEGKLKAWSTSELTLQQGNGQAMTLSKPDVARVVKFVGMARWQKAIIGSTALGTSAAAQAAWGCKCCTDCKTQGNAHSVAVAVGIIAGLGLLVWALFPQRVEEVYAAPRGVAVEGATPQ